MKKAHRSFAGTALIRQIELKHGLLFSKGFTLVEMIIVMVITGIIGGVVAMFLQAPVKQYTDVARRAELTDIADTAFYRLARDIRTAVPNSVSAPSASAIFFLPTKAGGRYRAYAPGAGGCAPNGDDLIFTSAPSSDPCFEVIGPAISAAAGDFLVVGSTQSDASLPYNQTVTGVLRPITAVSGAAITITNAVGLPISAQLDSQRFQVVDANQKEVRYECTGGQLIRYWNIPFNHSIAGASNAVLADNVSSCNIVYDIVNQRNGLVAITLTLTKDGESVTLYEEVHVNNAP